MEGKGILLHKHSVALVDGEAKSPDPSILRYGEIAINYATDHETISFKNQDDEIATFKTHKLYTQLLGDKQDKTDDSLTTQDKTIVGALNELKTDLDDSVEPYVVNLTNLLSANDSESISAAIGGIENLNSTISRNQVIFGVLATGTVAVGIRVFGNQTTLNYFVDSVLGLTINEITITNTDNTLSKTVETHAVLTENMVINSLTSDETTLPLSAAQGKALNEKILNSDKVYVVDGSIIDDGEVSSSEQISEAIGGWDNLVNAIQNNYIIILYFSSSESSNRQVILPVLCALMGTAIYIEFCTNGIDSVITITNESGELSSQMVDKRLVDTSSTYRDLQTSNKTFIGSINELNALVNSKASSQDITNAINALDSTGQTASTGEVISSVSQENGVISVSKKTLTSDDIPELPQSKITDLSTDLAAKQNATDNNLHTEDKTIVGAINEILPKATGVGKIDAASHGTGEIFNDYINNNASGSYAHAEGHSTIASGYAAHAEGEANFDDPSAIHMVGIGTTSGRKNAHVIKKADGSHYIIGIGGYEGQATDSAQSLQEVVNGKQDTLTAGTGIEITPENQINVTLDTTVFKVVSALPDSPAQGDENKIHLVSAESSGANNTYTEYVWVNSAWEILGEYTSEVDLTPYLKTSDAESTYLKITDAESEYATKTELEGKQNSTDDTLNTTSKTIVGAINEISSKVTGVGKIDPNSPGTGEIFNDYTNNKAIGNFAHAEGWLTTASGYAAHAEGFVTTASGDYAHAEGLYNYDDSSAIHMVGIGTSSSDRKNAHEIKREDGSHYVIGIGGYDGTNSDTAQSLQEVINSKQATVIDVSTLFADSSTITSELSSQIAAYGESTATDFPLMYAGATIGNIKPTWIRTNAGITNFMCIADNKIWYFEIQGTTVQRASLAIS